MAIVERWFSTTTAGAGDGTSWANRADLFSAGNWASEITGHNFTSDSLVCYIGPGSYTQSQALTSSILTSYGNADDPLILAGCDSSGNVLEFDDGWQSAQPSTTWEATLPQITLSASHFTNLSYLVCKGLQINSPNGNFAIAYDGINQVWDRCVFESNYNNSGAYLHSVNGQTRFVDCVWRTNGTIWDYFATGPRSMSWLNCRFEGATGGSGNRNGIEIGNSDHNNTVCKCTLLRCGGAGIIMVSTSTSMTATIDRNTVDECGNGIELHSTASQVRPFSVTNNMITNSTGYAIECQASNTWISHNRMRDSTSGNINNAGDWPTGIDNDTSTGTDGAEYADAAGDDFRIANTSTLHGQGYGAGDEPASGGGGTTGRQGLHAIGEGAV